MVLHTDHCSAKQFHVGLHITWQYKYEGNVAYDQEYVQSRMKRHFVVI